jgi:hypothetical protein
MATSIKLKGDIKKIEAAIKSKATPKTLVPKLEAQLDKLKSDLASLSSPKPKKGVTKTKVLSSLQKLKAKVKATKSLSGYKKSGIDIKKDADVPALPLGKRTAKTTGNTYYEYRLNRADVKQPPKRYPKLEDGGMMAKGGETFNYKKFGLNSKGNFEAEMGDEKYEIIYRDDKTSLYDLFKNGKKIKSSKSVADLMKLEYGGMMAKGGKISDKQMQRLDSGFEFIIYTDLPRQYGQYHISMAKEKGDVVYIVKSGHVADSKKVKTFTSEKDAFDYLTNKFGVKVSRKKMNYEDGGMMADGGKTEEEPKVIRGYSDDEAYEYAMGGVTQHGLKVGDEIMDITRTVMRIYNKKSKRSFLVDISNGSRIKVGSANFSKYEEGGMMAQGGRTTSAINRDRAYKSNQPWEQDYQRKSNPKNPKYKSSSDFFEGGGEMHRLFEDGEV